MRLRFHPRPMRRRLTLVAALAICGTAAFSFPPRAPDPPDANRFTKRVLVDGLDEPFQLEFDGRGGVYWIERSSGNVKRLDEPTGEVTLLGVVPTTVVAEGGLMGILLAKDFEVSRQIYFYYTFVEDSLHESRLSRFTLNDRDRLEPGSEVVLLRWPSDTAGHMAGGMTWDASGNLYLSTGDNSEATQYSPFRFTAPGGAGQDALRTAANTNDLRGKILRIHPEADGSFTIPAGNLFPPGTPNTRPEIYTMGNRNAWRLSFDSRTGYLHWGEIGPDAGADSVGIGPMGYDEFNVAKGPGNFGWPMFIGYNRPYARFDYAADAYRDPFDPGRPVNSSPNNAGLNVLPSATPPLIAYPYRVSEEYPLLGSGGRAAVGGPIFHHADFAPGAKRVFPDYFEGKWLVIDYVRNWIMAVTLDPQSSRVISIERLLPTTTYLNPLDLTFGPDGDLYIVEYVLSLGSAGTAPRRLPLQGRFPTPGAAQPGGNPVRVAQAGSYLLRASYTDRGANGIRPITKTAQILLRQPLLAPQDADVISDGTSYAPSLGDPMFTVDRSGAYLGYTRIDLTGIDSIAVGVLTRFYA